MRKWLLSITIGIAVGMIQGLGETLYAIRNSEWLAHGLYNTALKLLVPAVNHRALVVCIASLVICAAWSARYKTNRFVRLFIDLVIVYTLLVAVRFDFVFAYKRIMSGIVRAVDDMNVSVLNDILASGMPQVIVSLLLIAGGVFVLVRIRANSAKALNSTTQHSDEATPSFADRLTPSYRYIHQIAARHWELDVIVLILFIGLNAASFGLDVANSHSVKSRPNVIIIQLDTLRADHVGCYGYGRNTTPNIDKLARDGMRFEKAIAPAPWTSASVAQYMTGRYLRVPKSFDFAGVPVNAVPISEALHDRGYVTACVTSNPMAGPSRGFSQGYDSFEETYADVSSQDVFAKTVSQLRRMKDRKFFMFALFSDPHAPYVLHKEHNFYPDYKGKLGKEINVRLDDRTDHISADDLEYMRAVYDSDIAYTDDYIGKLVSELKRLKLYDDTLIVLLSDHGEGFGEHGRLEHGFDLYDEALSVPLIIKLPGQRKGSLSSGVFPLIDLFPSIMDALRLKTSSFGVNGVARHLASLRLVRDMDIYSSTDFSKTNLESVRSKSYKLIVDMVSSKQELYSLLDDPGEKQNVIKSANTTGTMLAKTMKLMDEEINNSARHTTFQEYISPSKAATQSMRSNGYLQ